MKIRFSKVWIALLVTALFMTAVPVVVRADVEGLLAELNRKPAPERTKILVEGAQKERVVYYYGSTSLSDTQEVIVGSIRNILLLKCDSHDWVARRSPIES